MAMAIQLQTGLDVSTDADYFLSMLQNGEQPDISSERALNAVLEAVAAKVRQLELQWSESAPLRQLTELHYKSNATPIVAQDDLDFGDMWLKALSFMDLMYVKLSTAISSLAEHLEQAARKQSTLGMENLDGKVEQQMDKSKSVRSDVRYEPVNGVCDNLSQLGYNVDSLNQMVSRMKGKIMTSDEKQDPTNLRVWHLCDKDDGHKISGKAQGLKALADNLFPEDGSVGSDNQPRRLTRTNTVMYSS